MTKLPRLYVGDKFSRIVHPISVQITENITPLSTASITLPKGEELPARSYVELFTPYGSAGMYRVRSPHNNYGDGYSTAELEHMIAELGDYVVKEEWSKMASAQASIKSAFSHYKGNHWQLGSYKSIGSERIALEGTYDSVLNIIMSILEQKPDFMMAFDFTTSPWTLNIVKKGTAVIAEGRLSRNVTSATVTYDDSELVTRVWYQTFDSEGNGTWKSKDASTRKTYGVIEGTVNTSPDMTSEEITATVDTYIAEHKDPKTSVSIQATELYKITGERLDKFVVGDLYRLNLRDYDLTVELHITSITWSDVYNRPDAVTIHLGDEEDTVVTFLHNLDATGAGSSGTGGGRAASRAGQQATSFQQNFYKTDKYGEILEQAGMYLDSKGLLVYAQDKEKNIGSMFKVQSDLISAEVTRATTAEGTLTSSLKVQADKIEAEVTRATEAEGEISGKIEVEAGRVAMVVGQYQDGSNYIRGGQICLAINDSGSTALIQADHITLDSGDTTINDIFTVNTNYLFAKRQMQFIGSPGQIDVTTISNTTVTARNHYVNENGTLGFFGNPILYVGYADIQDMIIKAYVDEETNELKLWKRGQNVATDDPFINFKKAATQDVLITWDSSPSRGRIKATDGESTAYYSIAPRFQLHPGDQQHPNGQYVIELYHTDSQGNTPSLSKSSTEIQLGRSGMTVQIQNSRGNKIAQTPEYVIPLTDEGEFYQNGFHYPPAGYLGFSEVSVNVGSVLSWDSTTTSVRALTGGSRLNYYSVDCGFLSTPDGYIIQCYHTDDGGNVSWLSGTSTTYKLGRSGTTVQLQRLSGTQFANTPTYTIPLKTETINSNGEYTPPSGYVGFSSVKVDVDAPAPDPGTIDVNTGGGNYWVPVASGLAGIAYALGTSTSNLNAIFGGTAVTSGRYYGFKVTCGDASPRYYYFAT